MGLRKLVFPRLGWFPAVAIAVALIGGLTLLPGAASASPPIAGGNVTTDRDAGPDTQANFSIIDRNNPIDGDGLVTSWTIYAKESAESQDQIRLKIYRAAGGSSFLVVGESALVTPDLAGGQQTFTLATPIVVQAGDLVGMYVNEAGVVPFTAGSPIFETNLTHSSLFNITGGQAAPDATETFDSSGVRTYSISVNGAGVTLTLAPETASDIVGQQHTVTAALDESVEGVPIRFAVTGGPNVGVDGTVTTDTSGQASFSYTGNGGVGDDTIVAWVDTDGEADLDAGEPQDEATQTWVAPASFSLTPLAATNLTGSTHAVVANIGESVAGVRVEFRVNSGPNNGESISTMTDENGEAGFTYTGDGGEGVDTIVAWADLDENGQVDAGEPQAGVTKTWATHALSIEPATATNLIDTTHTVTADIGVALADVDVLFEVTAGPNVGDTQSVATDADGLAAFTVTGDGGTGVDTIRAAIDLDSSEAFESGEPFVLATKTWVSRADVTSIAVSPSSATNLVGTEHTVTAAISPVLESIPVRFRVTQGPNVNENGQIVTGTDGKAAFAYTGDGGVGTDTIFAWVDVNANGEIDSGEPQGSVQKTWATSTATSIAISPSSDTNIVNTQHTVTATVSPATGGEPVRFRITAGPNVNDAGSGTTDGNGKSTFTYTGDGGTGADTIVAWVDKNANGVLDSGEPQSSATKTWVAAGSVTSIALSPSSDTNVVNTQHTVTATVTPAISGVIVRFKVTSGPNVNDNGLGTTNTSGQTTFTYTGDGGTGTDTILAWADLDNDGVLDSGEAQTSATKAWIASGSVTSIALSPPSDVNQIGAAHTVTATITPALSGVIVRFKVTSGPNVNDNGAGTTNTSGQTTFTYTGDGGIGTDTILAWADLDNDGVVDSGEVQTSATKTWTATETATSISLSPASDTNPVNTLHTLTATVSPVQSGVLVRFRIASGPNLADSSASFTNAAGQATFSYTGDGGVGTDLIVAWADLDGDGVVDSNEPQAAATKAWTASTSQSITLEPATDSNPVGTTHTVTAQVSPVASGVIVRFRVDQGPNTGDNAAGATDVNGRVSFTYLGDGGAGIDVIRAWIDLNNNGVRDANEPQTLASKVWTASTAQTVTLAPATDTNPVGASHTVTATVTPQQQGLLFRFRITSGPNAGDSHLAVTNGVGQATFTYTGDGGAGTDVIVGWIDLNSNGVVDANEPQSAAHKTWAADTPASGVTLAPATDQLQLGERHQMTATVTPAVSGTRVRFRVLAGPNEGASGSAQTNSQGKVSLSYKGDGGLGTDIILAWADNNNDGQPSAGEPQASATAEWVETDAAGSVPVDAEVAAICNNLTGFSHPSLGTLCFLVQSGQVPAPAQAAISRVIIRKGDASFPGGPPFGFKMKLKFDEKTLEFKFEDGEDKLKFKIKKNGKSKFDIKEVGRGGFKFKGGDDHDDHDDHDDDDDDHDDDDD